MQSKSLQQVELVKERIRILEELAREITPQYKLSPTSRLLGTPIKELAIEYLLLEQVPGLVRALIDTLEPVYTKENKERLKLRLLRGFNGKTIAEIGCGPGLFHPFFHHYGAEIVGVEINPHLAVGFGLGIYSPEDFKVVTESSSIDIAFSCRVFNKTNPLNLETLVFEPLHYLKHSGLLMHYAIFNQLNEKWRNVEEISKGKLKILEYYNEAEIGSIGEYAIWRKV